MLEGSPPLGDRPAQGGEFRRWEPELVVGQPLDPAEHLGEHAAVEAAVLLGGELAEVVEPEPWLDGSEVDEVSGLGSAEQCEHLVGDELLERQDRPDRARLGLAEASVDAQVDVGPVAVVGVDGEAGEAVIGDDPLGP